MKEKTEIIICGDLCPTDDTRKYFQDQDDNSLFNDIMPIFKNADFVLGNLEFVLTDSPKPITKAGPILHGKTSYIKTLKAAGIDAVSLANNHKNYIILDFGTATTFDVLMKNSYSGGIIAPGVRLSLNTLADKATLIPKINLKKIKKVIGRDTISAVRSGFFWGYAGLIDNIINLIKKETRKSFKVIITGGFSDLFKKSIKTKVYHNKDITINGLIKISKLIK